MKQINLLPLDAQGNQKKIEFILLFLGVLVLNFLLLGLLGISISSQIRALNSDEKQAFSQLNLVALAIKKLEKIKKQSDQLQAAKWRLSINHKQIQEIVALLKDLHVLAPPDFFIKTISYKMSYLLIVGSTKTERNFLELIKKLEKKYRLKFNCNYKKNKNLLFEIIVNIPFGPGKEST